MKNSEKEYWKQWKKYGIELKGPLESKREDNCKATGMEIKKSWKRQQLDY